MGTYTISKLKDRLKNQFELERTELLNESNRITADWRTELLLDEISDEGKLKLSEWLAYNKAVKSTKLGEDWPEKPSHQ